jgi:hypothetical protein
MKMGYGYGYVVDLMCYGELVGSYVELNEFGEGSDTHLLHVTQTPIEPVTLVILSFLFLALVVVDAPCFFVMKEI